MYREFPDLSAARGAFFVGEIETFEGDVEGFFVCGETPNFKELIGEVSVVSRGVVDVAAAQIFSAITP